MSKKKASFGDRAWEDQWMLMAAVTLVSVVSMEQEQARDVAILGRAISGSQSHQKTLKYVCCPLQSLHYNNNDNGR